MANLGLYSPLRARSTEDYPASPFVHLCLGTYTVHKQRVLLSEQLATNQEIDDFVNRLKAQLDELGRAAKKELRVLGEKMLAE